ncbi:low affinity immunoglobulin epsilon Fc receptor-like [Drosophila biarmipes]|uniref:low affinity immunoglobulin epsilon Fc receptor-like n=1 Tax=Drosophila biarmipes TaxID=125945 RepID=UPI0007E87E7F|nr:low affinity immunoglobulin epsilon Fc receptor-like [Drosophila biarmipes]
MISLRIFFSFVIIFASLCGSQTKSLDGDFPKNIIKTPVKEQWLKIFPFLDYIAKQSKCYVSEDLQKTQSAIQEDNQGRLTRIESQQTELQENLKFLLERLKNSIPEDFGERLVRMEDRQTSLQEILKNIPSDIEERLSRMEDRQKSLGAQLEARLVVELQAIRKTIPENFEERLAKMEVQQISLQDALKKIPGDFGERMDRLEEHENDMQKDLQTRMDTQKAALEDALSTNFTRVVRPKFEQIGSRLFYIESKRIYNWNDAVSTCRELGGYIASVKDKEELDAIAEKLGKKRYWLGINDRASKGNYINEASGKKSEVLNWRNGEPNHGLDGENCVEIVGGVMNDEPCSNELRLICQSDNEV